MKMAPFNHDLSSHICHHKKNILQIKKQTKMILYNKKKSICAKFEKLYEYSTKKKKIF